MKTFKQYLEEGERSPEKIAKAHLETHTQVFADDHNVQPHTEQHWHEVFVNARDDYLNKGGKHADAVRSALRDWHHTKVPVNNHAKHNKAIGLAPRFDTTK